MNQPRLSISAAVFLLIISPAIMAAENDSLQLAAPLRDNAILQQQIPVPIWGKAQARAKISVTFDSQTKTTVADDVGDWKLALDPMPADKLKTVSDAPEGRTMTVSAELNGEKVEKSIKNLLIGEVWLCSGQSNMGGGVRRSPYPKDSIEKANYPALRTRGDGDWIISTPQTSGNFSRLAFCFGREIQAHEKVPVGLIVAAVGGTSIQSWSRPPGDKPVSEKGLGSNYIPHIKPLIGYGMRGAIWYQGEANVNDGEKYRDLLKSMIEDWRASWGIGDFSFYYVQIAGIGESPKDKPAMGDGRASIRQAQFEVLAAVKNTGMAVTLDVSSEKEHPINKYDVGLRLARWALHRDYGHKDLVPSGPLYKSFEVEGSKIRVKFDYTQNGLMLAEKKGYEPPAETPNAPIPWLSIRDKDGSWHWAEGVIDGSDLIVSSKEVKNPTAVRYAYTVYPIDCNLYNKDGLPAGPFSTCGY